MCRRRNPRPAHRAGVVWSARVERASSAWRAEVLAVGRRPRGVDGRTRTCSRRARNPVPSPIGPRRPIVAAGTRGGVPAAMHLRLSRNAGPDRGSGRSRLGRSRTLGPRCWRPGRRRGSSLWLGTRAGRGARGVRRGAGGSVGGTGALPAHDELAIGEVPSPRLLLDVEQAGSARVRAEARPGLPQEHQFGGAVACHRVVDFAPSKRG